MNKISCLLVTLVFLFSCTQNQTEEKSTVKNVDTLFDAVGIVMNADTIKAPLVITALPGKTVKAGIPHVISFKENYGEAGGISYMQNYTTDNGLALDAISFGHKSALCDRNGNLWFGTYGGGVSRYDGKSFTNFTNSQGLANNVVLSIAEDKSGNLWFGTEGGGVSRYDGKSFINYTSAQGLANDVVLCIIEDKIGNLWFGTEGGGVSCYDGKTFTNYTSAQGLANDVVLSITEDKGGNLWFGTEGGGVSCYDRKGFTNFTTAQGLGGDAVRCMAVDKSGNLWFGTEGGGASRYDGKTFANYTNAQGLADDVVYSITEDKSGNIWFGTFGGGVSRYDGKDFTNFTSAQGLVNNIVLSITEDKSGNLWFGTSGGGVSRYDGKGFTNYTNAQGLANNVVLGIGQDKNGNLWFGTEGGGVSRYDGKSFTNFTSAQGLASNIVRSITEDKNGNLWFGTSGAGVSCYDGKSFTNYTSAQGLANNAVYCLAEDKKGNLWFGTYGGGVSRYDGKNFTNYTSAQGLANNIVLCITEDKSGKLWFGTSGAGVSCYDGKSFTNFNSTHGLANNIVRSIAEDKNGNLWFGTYGGGVSRYDGKSFTNFTRVEGLPDNSVTQIIVSKDQNIVVATNFGVGVLTAFIPKGGINKDKSNTSPVTNLSNRELKNYEPLIEVYNSSTGYPVKDVNAGSHCLFEDSKGIMWMATGADKTALVRVDYASINRNPDPPTVVIESVKINDEKICWYNFKTSDSITRLQQEVMTYGDLLTNELRDSLLKKFSDIKFDDISKFYPVPQNLELPYDYNHVTLEFNAIEPARPYAVKYQYILEGYDKEWAPITHKTDVSYGNIYEGTYTFKLKACSPVGIWSEPVTYTFKVLPPWYRTWWMYTVYALCAITSFTLIVWLNGRRLRARAKELKMKVDEATQEITEQKYLIEEKHKEITDSIHYAERIQRSFLATKKHLDENLGEYFIFFQPKDVVSGDFYWSATLNNGKFVLATADSTGHGVPGAIMSLLNITSLEKAIEKETSPDKVLNVARNIIIDRLKKDGSNEGGKDGMDCSLCVFDFANRKLSVASGNNPVWIVRTQSDLSFRAESRNGSAVAGLDLARPDSSLSSVIEIKPDKMPVGKHDKQDIPFTLHEIDLQKGDVIYTLTDGFPDQFGGENGKKFMIKNLRELLQKNAQLRMEEQKELLERTLIEWAGNLERVDDITIIGIRVK